ncbi:MAG TPA: 3D-(3,5/4)-trihydroxycyclohexane-1,2-dione acylhydrolase (decyclizing) [Gaiellales bacterium]
MTVVRLTVAQALVRFLTAQSVERDGDETPFFAGAFGIFGHGNLAGVGQAIHQEGMRFVPARNEQAMVHAAIAYARARRRLATWACTSSVGPGATNMLTGAALATINRLPVLLLPGDIFATRRVDPVLQQLEAGWSRDVSVNDAFRPVSRYWDRINRPEQLGPALLEAMRVLTDPAETGAVTLCLPQDVQAEAYDFPVELLEPRLWRIGRPLPDARSVGRALEAIRTARTPLIVAGGGVHHSDATEALRAFAEQTGIPVAETQAGKGALAFDHPLSLGAIGATGTSAANLVARDADLVIGVGTRYADFTTASRTAFQHADVRMVNINVGARDASKLGGEALTGDARATLELLASELQDLRTGESYASRVSSLVGDWQRETDRLVAGDDAVEPTQSQVIGAVNDAAGERGVVVCAAGSLPGDLHKLWRPRHPTAYHVEYGYSCMGYEVAGGIGVRLAEPDREVYVMVGDGSWLLMSSELVTAAEQGVRVTCVLIDNYGYGSIGGLSRSLGSEGFGTDRSVGVDLEANARSLGAEAVRVTTLGELRAALAEAPSRAASTVIVVECDPLVGVPSYESWWDVPVAEVSEQLSVDQARRTYERERARERPFF